MFFVTWCHLPTRSPTTGPLQKPVAVLHMESRIKPLSAGAVPLCRKGRNLNTFKPLQVRSRGKG